VLPMPRPTCSRPQAQLPGQLRSHAHTYIVNFVCRMPDGTEAHLTCSQRPLLALKPFGHAG
jgi:hypothetical protein